MNIMRPRRAARHQRQRTKRGSTAPVVQLRGVDAHHDRTLALHEVSLSIDAGTVTAVIGPNGAGKSTMFALISGRLMPSTGTVATCGMVADVLQATTIDPQLRLTVDDVVRMGRYPSRGLMRPMRRCDRYACDEALDRVGLLDLRHQPINELSGGQRQRQSRLSRTRPRTRTNRSGSPTATALRLSTARHLVRA